MSTGRIYRVVCMIVLLAMLLTWIPQVTVAGPSAQGTTVYYVQFGDTLFSISRRFSTTVPAIMQANGLVADYIYAGQRLTIPLGVSPTVQPPPNYTCKYSVQRYDTVYSIAYRYQIPWYSLMQANNLYSPYIVVGMQLNVPCQTPTPAPFPTYTVVAGDNLFRIAVKYETSIYAIAVVNRIPNPNLIFVGQNLIVPYTGTVKYGPVPTVTPTVQGSGTAVPTATATTSPNVSAVVVMTNNAYVPNNSTVAKGSTILWKNTDSAPHTVTSGAPGNITNVFRSGALSTGQTFTFTFNDAGTFTYFSESDPGMTGTITVQ